ncbi:butyrate kinase, partial [Desulfovibrio sp. OttesenSCG-928-C06]|nr:butyrate kinase [Desulfovibrio sp. OttesenSCG-928-C06]
YRILVVNMGSTSSKVAVYDNGAVRFSQSIGHPRKELDAQGSVFDQYGYRLKAVSDFLTACNLNFSDFDILVSRGGNARPAPGGIYVINQAMLDDMRSGRYGVHPNYNGNRLVYEMGLRYGVPAINLDAPTADEFCEEARMTGLPEIKRISSGHFLSQKATARKIAAELGLEHQKTSMIVCHLGGGISVGAHKNGRLIDLNNALDGDGPMSPERAGSIPAGDLVDMCFSGQYSRDEMRRKLTGQGGWTAHLGTADGRELIARVQADEQLAVQVFTATMYQVAKQIGAMAAVLGESAQAIGLTGSLAHSTEIVEEIRQRTAYLKLPLYVFAGENEMEALCAGALRYLRGEEQPQVHCVE